MYDLLIIILYLTLVAGLGYYFGRGEKTSEDFFLAGRKMGWIPVGLSLLATEISAVTFVGHPEIGFTGNYLFLQFAFGSLLGRILIAFVLLPGFFRHRVETIYAYFEERFGSLTRKSGSIFFIITRILASGVRLYAATLTLIYVTGWPLKTAILVVLVVSVLYTSLGGLKAVIWTDTLQIFLFFGGALFVLAFLLKEIPEGLQGVFDLIHQHKITTGEDKFKIFDFTLSLRSSQTFWVALVFGCVMTFASMGADQDLAQRLLSCEKLKQSQRAIIISGFIVFPVVILFLFIGSSLFAFFQLNPEVALPDEKVKIFPFFIANLLPPGLKGLLIASVLAAAMSSLDSALNALSSTVVLDLLPKKVRKNPHRVMWISRGLVLVFGGILGWFALGCEGQEGLVLFAFKLASFTYGSLLGIFLLGRLTHRGNDLGNIIAMIFSPLLLLGIHFTQKWYMAAHHISEPYIAWSWYITIGTFSTFLIAFCFKTEEKKNIG